TSAWTKNSFIPLSPPVTITTSFFAQLDQGHGVVHRGMHDVELAGGEPIALLRRVLGKGELQGEVASRENPLRHTGMQRQRLGVGEAVDANRSRIGGGGRGCDRRQDENPSLDHSPSSG